MSDISPPAEKIDIPSFFVRHHVLRKRQANQRPSLTHVLPENFQVAAPQSSSQPPTIVFLTAARSSVPAVTVGSSVAASDAAQQVAAQTDGTAHTTDTSTRTTSASSHTDRAIKQILTPLLGWRKRTVTTGKVAMESAVGTIRSELPHVMQAAQTHPLPTALIFATVLYTGIHPVTPVVFSGTAAVAQRIGLALPSLPESDEAKTKIAPSAPAPAPAAGGTTAAPAPKVPTEAQLKEWNATLASRITTDAKNKYCDVPFFTKGEMINAIKKANDRAFAKDPKFRKMNKNEMTTYLAIAGAESGGCRTSTLLNTDGSIDRGWGQINSVHKNCVASALFALDGNIDCALGIWRGGTKGTPYIFDPWVTYWNEAYKKYLPEAKEAVDDYWALHQLPLTL